MDTPRKENANEQLLETLYLYRYGTIGFLELLDRFEKILAVVPSQTDHDPSDAHQEQSAELH